RCMTAEQGVASARGARRVSGGLGILVLLCSPVAHGADPQPYNVKLADTRDSALNDMLKSTSELLALRKSAPVGPFGLIGRAQSDVERLKTVLESFGYYQSSVSITIDSLPLNDPGLGADLTNKSAKDEARIDVSFNLGPLYHLGKIELTGE